MSSPSSSSSKPSTTDNLYALTKNIQFFWFVGHIVTFFSSVLYLLTFRSGGLANTLFFRLAYLGVIESFGIILYQSYKGRQPTLQLLFGDDNAQYTFDALLWFFAPVNTLSLAPFVIFSLFHSLTYIRNQILPALNYSQTTSTLGKISTLITNNNDSSLVLVANLEFFLLVVLIFKALFFMKRSWIILVGYTLFMKLRYEKSVYTKAVLKAYEVRIDGVFSDSRLPPNAKQYWAKLKAVLSATLGTPLAANVASKNK
ncbi:nucleoporin [Saccharomycopsis crataegensis]|uniref:Nucleoporin n=1 Tax=Saccharomycopsis crataegensis TaxID=43959 RepID=A0AAV5QKT7_9ASCO|nr:nucleoporin [Saccharomycopsis crataegensis]